MTPVVLVSGGSSGLDEAAALRFALDGATLVVATRRRGRGEEAGRRVRRRARAAYRAS